MAELSEGLRTVRYDADRPKADVVDDVRSRIEASGLTIVEEDVTRPWGAFFRLDNANADEFVADFFTDLSLEDARLGNPDAELSPKILLVSPEQRLSWQYHDRRAELWKFVTEGGYYRNLSDEQGNLVSAEPGDVVQFAGLERHRLVALGHYTAVAEIWQHTDPSHQSDEADIVRIQDDYRR